MEGYFINQRNPGMYYKNRQVLQSFQSFMIHDFLLFFKFTASLNFQSKARQLIVEPIRQTVVRIVLWFEEIYKFNRISNILYRESILEHKRNKLYNIITLLYFFHTSKHLLGLMVFRGDLTKENYDFRFLSFSKLGGRRVF